VEEHRQFPVIDGHLRQDGGERPEEERQAGAVVHDLAPAEVPDVLRGRAAQMTSERVAGDVSHELSFIVTPTIKEPLRYSQPD